MFDYVCSHMSLLMYEKRNDKNDTEMAGSNQHYFVSRYSHFV